MKNLRASLACIALVLSAAACSDANPLTAPGAPRFDGGQHGGGDQADFTTAAGTQDGSGSSVAPEDGGGVKGSGGFVTTADDGGQHGDGNDPSTDDGGGMPGSGGKEAGGHVGSGG